MLSLAGELSPNFLANGGVQHRRGCKLNRMTPRFEMSSNLRERGDSSDADQPKRRRLGADHLREKINLGKSGFVNGGPRDSARFALEQWTRIAIDYFRRDA